MIVIGFCGYARVGKDAAVTALKPMEFTRVAYADALKSDFSHFIQCHYGWDVFNLTDEQKKIVRPYLVAHGAGMRAADPWHWIHMLNNTLEPEESADAGLDRIAISDVRYLNEVIDILENKKGRVIYINRPGFGPMNEEEKRSFNEIFASKYNYNGETFPCERVWNDGTLEEFQDKVRRMVMIMLQGAVA